MSLRWLGNQTRTVIKGILPVYAVNQDYRAPTLPHGTPVRLSMSLFPEIAWGHTGRPRHERGLSAPRLLACVTTQSEQPNRDQGRGSRPADDRAVSSAVRDTASQNRSPPQLCRRRSDAW